MRHATGWGAALVLAWAAPAWAEALSTDRPDIAESSRSVGRGVYQIEQAVQPDWGPGASWGLGFPSLHRLGIHPDWELRVETPIVQGGSSGVAPATVGLGTKWAFFTPERDFLGCTASWISHLEREPGGTWSARNKLCIDREVGGGWSSGLNLFSHWNWGQGLGPQAGFAWAFAHELPWLEGLRCYGELSGDTDAAGGPATAGVDGGLAWVITPDMQLDSALYRGLDGSMYWTVGWSQRWGAPKE